MNREEMWHNPPLFVIASIKRMSHCFHQSDLLLYFIRMHQSILYACQCNGSEGKMLSSGRTVCGVWKWGKHGPHLGTGKTSCPVAWCNYTPNVVFVLNVISSKSAILKICVKNILLSKFQVLMLMLCSQKCKCLLGACEPNLATRVRHIRSTDLRHEIRKSKIWREW
jgi:hypothetical protein